MCRIVQKCISHLNCETEECASADPYDPVLKFCFGTRPWALRCETTPWAFSENLKSRILTHSLFPFQIHSKRSIRMKLFSTAILAAIAFQLTASLPLHEELVSQSSRGSLVPSTGHELPHYKNPGLNTKVFYYL